MDVSQAELIAELYQSETWVVLEAIANQRKQYHIHALQQPSVNFPDDFYKKEVHSGQLLEITQFMAELETEARRYLSGKD